MLPAEALVDEVTESVELVTRAEVLVGSMVDSLEFCPPEQAPSRKAVAKTKKAAVASKTGARRLVKNCIVHLSECSNCTATCGI